MVCEITRLSNKVKHCCNGLCTSVAGAVTSLSGKKIIAGISLLFLLLSGLQTRAQQFAWANAVGSSLMDDWGFSVAVDDSGNVYVTGTFWFTVDFDPAGSGNGSLTSRGNADVFLAKYDRDGNYVWANRIGNVGADFAYSVAVDDASNVYVTGAFFGTAYFNPASNGDTLRSIGGTDIFLAKYDTDGNYIWAKSMGGEGSDYGYNISLDDSANIYLAGYFNSTAADFDPGTGTAFLGTAGNNDIFVAKYDTDGNYVWAKRMGGRLNDHGRAVAVNKAGDVYITGYFNDTAYFNGTSGRVISKGANDIYVAKYDRNGNYVWVNSMGSRRADNGFGITADDSGYVYITGQFNDTVDFNPGTGIDEQISVAGFDAFVAKYDADGNYVWAKSMGGTGGDLGWGIALDGAGNVSVSGTFFARGDFNKGTGVDTLLSRGNGDIYVAKYSSNGEYLWAVNMGGSRIDEGYGMALDKAGNAHVTGYFYSSNADFNPGPDSFILVNTGGFESGDMFLVKLACRDTSSSYLTVSTCKSDYTLNDNVYTTNGTYTQVIPNALGCDSAITLELSFYELNPVITVDSFLLGVHASYSTYQWLKEGVVIPDATDSTYTVTENGNYQVVVTNEEGCSDTSDVYPVNNVSIDRVNNMDMQVGIYPNPSDDVIYINSPVNVSVNLCSADGRILLSQRNAKNISVKDLADGIYLLHITDRNGNLIKVEKVIKQ